MEKYTCEICNMKATHTEIDEKNSSHFFCDHHSLLKKVRNVQTFTVSKLKKYLPLAVIFLFISIITTAASILNDQFSSEFAMRVFMGSFFAIFGFFKVINLKAFAEAYSTYDIVSMRWRAYAFIYPFIEISLAFLYLFNFGGVYRDLFTLILMLVGGYGIFLKLKQKEEIPCACLGMVFKVPMTWVTLAEDLLMGLMSFFSILMVMGKYVATFDTKPILLETLKVHTTAEWVQNSTIGHWIVGVFLLLTLITSLLSRFNVYRFTKYIIPIIFIILGLFLSIVEVVWHSIDSDPKAIWYLLTHNSQFLQHFLGGCLFILAGVLEIRYLLTRKMLLRFATPLVVSSIGTIFFFHQQLGAIESIAYAMGWHMLFGSFMVTAGVFRTIDILLDEEHLVFYWVWAAALTIGSIMMLMYTEPTGAFLI